MVTEWLKVLAWKAGVPYKGYRGFESLPLRKGDSMPSSSKIIGCTLLACTDWLRPCVVGLLGVVYYRAYAQHRVLLSGSEAAPS